MDGDDGHGERGIPATDRGGYVAERLDDVASHEAVGHFALGIAHDFNNILTILQCSLDVTRSSIELGRDPAAVLDRMDEVLVRGSQLANQLLTLAERRKVAHRRFRLETWLAEVAVTNASLVAPVRLELVLAEGGLDFDDEIFANADQLEQVVTNLCINAKDALEDRGTIWLSVHACPAGRSAFDPDRPWVELRVEDDGPGVPRSLQPRVFDPFFTTKGAGKGSGLGLSVVRSIMAAHGGHVSVGPREGGGARFSAWFPRP